MTIQQPIGNFVGLALWVGLTATLVACSSDSASQPGASGMSAGGGGGGGGDVPRAGAGNGSGASSAGSGNVIPSDPSLVVGTFAIQMKVDKGMTSVVGQVADGPVPANIIWTETKKDGVCHVEVPSSPFCEQGCGADVCVAPDECRPYPTGRSVGAVTLKGVRLEDGGTEVALKEINASYQLPAGKLPAYPAFGADDTVQVHAAGKDYPGFDLSAKGVEPIELLTADFALAPDKPFELAWTPAADPESSQIHVRIDLSHHGGVKGLIQCDVEDGGSLVISQSLIAELIGLGVAGYPSVVITRSSLDSVQLDHGRVRLEVSSLVERYLTTPGVESCTTDADCTGEKTCRSSDSTCQ